MAMDLTRGFSAIRRNLGHLTTGVPPETTEDVEEACLDVLQVEWRALTNAAPPEDGSPLRVLFVGGGHDLRAALQEKLSKAAFGSFKRSAAPSLDAVVFLGGLEEEPELAVLEQAVRLAQVGIAAIWDGTPCPQLAFVTRATQDDCTKPGSYVHAGLWGLARTMRVEAPGIKIRCLDLDAEHLTPGAGVEAIAEQCGSLMGLGAGAAEMELAVRERTEVSRLTRSPVQVLKPMRLQMSSTGSLLNLQPVPQTQRPAPGQGQVELRIRAISLDLSLLGLSPDDHGFECAGTVVTGEAAGHRLGHDVFGVARGCPQSYACAEGLLLAPKPEAWSFEQMAAWPTAFATVEQAFVELAPLKQGERVLIHAAAGGVGHVAVQFAQRVGATIFATCRENQMQHLKDLGVKYVASSRDAKAFDEGMRRFMEEDGADDVGGIDVVLHSLSHEDYIPKSLSYLRPNGRFVEIGKRGIWTNEEMSKERPDVLYHKVAMDWVMANEPERLNGLMKKLHSQIEQGVWNQIPVQCFEGLESVVDALCLAQQQGQQIGKVVLTQPSHMGLVPDGRYVLSGGLGALGLVTAKMLAEEGAKSVVLLSRTRLVGVGERRAMWRHLQDSQLDIQWKPCDVSNLQAVQEMAMSLDTSFTVRGLIHLAALLDDKALVNITRRQFEKAYGAKVFGARHLRECLSAAQKLNFTVLFSSASGLLGSSGQASSAAANAALDAHARCWKAMGEPVVAVQWGPWSQGGSSCMAKSNCLGSIGILEGMAALSSCLRSTVPVVAVCPIYWDKYLKHRKHVPPLVQAELPECGHVASAVAESVLG